LYDSYGIDSIKYILNQAEIVAVFLDCKERLHNVLHVINELPYLKLIIYFDELTKDDYLDYSIPETIEIISFKDLMKIGKNNLRSPVVCFFFSI
jgi:long-subunit acyl-CoA synthetase (AMP-forming)